MAVNSGRMSDENNSNLLQSIIETAPDAIVTIDSAGVILSFSPAAEKIFGYTQNEVTGQNVKMLMPEPYHAEHDGYVSRYLSTGEKRIIGIGREVRAKRKNGEVFVAELAVGEVAADSTVVFTGFLRDVTDRVDAQRRATRLQQSLDQMARMQMLGEMSSALAHEINQPLTAVSNFARAAGKALEEPEVDQEKLTGYLGRIAEQSQRAGQIIRRMRKLAERGQSDLVPENINAIVLEAIRSYTGLEQPDPEITLELVADLPDVMADRVQIQQVVINLVRNAQEATAKAQGHEVHVDTGFPTDLDPIRLRAAQPNPNEVVITISDGGTGIPEDLIEKLFEPFVTTKLNGLGVGLAICRSIVHAHGGKIWADNNPEGGAEFHFTLPVAGAAP